MIEFLQSLLGVLKWLFGLVFNSYAVSQAHSREHDVALFKKGDATVNEAFLDALLNRDLYDQRCWLEDIRTVRHFCEDFGREENQFLDRKVRKAALNAVQKLAAVDAFVATNFFPVNDSDKLRLYPEMRHSDDEKLRNHYRKHAKELNALTEAAWDAYRQYRAAVRERLKV